MGTSLQSISQAVEEITRIHRSLPSRPDIDEVEAAMALVSNLEKEEDSRIDAILNQRKAIEIPQELFLVLQEMQKNLVYSQCRDRKMEALRLLDLESTHVLFDELIQRASHSVTSTSGGSVVSSASSTTATGATCRAGSAPYMHHSEKGIDRSSERMTRDDSYVKKARPSMHANGFGAAADPNSSRGFLLSSTMKPDATTGEDNGKLSLIKLASLIEVSSKKDARDLNLCNKLMDQIDWLPDSIGKLRGVVTLDLSENRIVALPTTVGLLSSLTKLDLHSNWIAQLPDSVGDLSSLSFFDLRGNQLSILPPTFTKLVNLVELDLSSNRLSLLPDSIGNLTSLKKLNIETNDIEELPYTIGQCSALVELRADYNRLKGLPEAVGRLESLEILSIRYNNIKGLPTTMASLSRLREVDVSFNELETIPESFCLATKLVKLNVGNNFSDLRFLPNSIGNLEMLEQLDISNNQIRFLPESFRMLCRLRVLHAEENPLEVPPRHVAEMGAQAVVQYMAELVAKRDVKPQPLKAKNSWAQLCFLSRPNKRKHEGLDLSFDKIES